LFCRLHDELPRIELYASLGDACFASYKAAAQRVEEGSRKCANAAKDVVHCIDQFLEAKSTPAEMSCLLGRLVDNVRTLRETTDALKETLSDVRGSPLFSAGVTAAKTSKASNAPANQQKRKSAVKTETALDDIRHTAGRLDDAIQMIDQLIGSWALLQTSVQGISLNDMTNSQAPILKECKTRWSEIETQYCFCANQASLAMPMLEAKDPPPQRRPASAKKPGLMSRVFGGLFKRRAACE
jgi:hypothetical protein